jgi:hypothetical protein
VPDFDNLSDHAFLQTVDRYFESGDLLPIYHRYPGIAEPGPNGKPSDAPPSPKPQNEKPDPDDPSTFDPTDDPLQQGICLLNAADNGTPFLTMAESPKSGG